MKSSGLGIRGLFRIAILIVVAIAFITLASLSYTNVSSDEKKEAEASIRSETNYLCLQLESIGNRASAFTRVADQMGVDPEELDNESLRVYRLLTDPVGDILMGYTLVETGTVLIIENGQVVASDDQRVPVGSDVEALLGDEVHAAIGSSIQNDETEAIPYIGVFDEPAVEGAYGDGDDEAILFAERQNDYTVAVIQPMSMVMKDMGDVMGREIVAGLVILMVVGLIVDRLLSLVVARRIDRTNEALSLITSGDLDIRVDEGGTREFISLANGINVTVEALQGWIAEAESRMDSELAAARAIQESALPRTFPPYPEISKFDVYAIMDAAKEVGGDFYDIFLVGDNGSESGKLAFLVADVSGKGVPAALFMMKAKTQVRRELQSGLDLSTAIERANAEIAEGNDSCMFVTMWVGLLDYETGHVEYVNAGHNPPLIWQGKAGWSWLKARSGLPLGFPFSTSYKTYSIECSVGDKILLYTDGVTEAMSKDGELYGDERLEAAVNLTSEACPRELVKAVRDDVAMHALDAEQSDDITVLVLELGLRTDS